MTINERLKLLRKELGLTQIEFGEKIGLKKSAASQVEKDGYSINPRLLQLICSTFNISEKWLTEGKGDMYTSDEEAILEKLAGMYNLSESQLTFAKQWLQLPAATKDAVVDYIASVASALQEKKSKKIDVSESDTSKKVNINNLDSCHQPASPAGKNNSAPPADNSRPENLTDEEWQLIQMARQEKRQASQTSSSTNSDIA